MAKVSGRLDRAIELWSKRFSFKLRSLGLGTEFGLKI